MKSNSSTRAEESHYQSRTSLDLSIMEAADDHTRTQIFMILFHTEVKHHQFYIRFICT